MPKKIKRRTGQGSMAPGTSRVRGLFDRISTYAEEHRKRIIPAAIALVAVTVLALGFWALQSYRDRAASAKLAEAMEFYSPSPGVPPDYAKALELFRKVGEDYGSTLNGAIAQYYAANTLMHVGKTDEALAAYESFVKDQQGRRFLVGLVHQRLGYVYLSRGNPAEAVTAFEEAEKRLGPGVATFELAQLYEQRGDSAKSQEKYRLILDALPGTAWAFEAMRRLPPPAAAPAPAPAAPK